MFDLKKKQSKKKKKKRNNNDNTKLIYLFVFIVLFLGAVIYSLTREAGPEGQNTILAEKKDPYPAPSAVSPGLGTEPEKGDVGASGGLPKIAIIIDDIGYNKKYRDFISIKIPITLAVIPFTPYSHEAAVEANSAGAEIMLHLPMEPKDYPETDPGKGALLLAMNEERLIGQLKEDLDAVPHIKGVNNHMGSRFTESAERMGLVLHEIKSRNLFFVDSKTSFDSQGYSVASEMNIRTAERSVFLDNIQTEEAIREQLTEAVKAAKQKGTAIAIGHPYPITIAALEKAAPALRSEGVELVTASAIVR